MRNWGKSGKRVAVGTLARPLLREGFTPVAARRWVRELYRDWATAAGSPAEIRRAHRAGFTSAVHSLTASADAGHDVFAQRDYYALFPLNPPQPWLANRVVAVRRLPGLAARMPERIAVVSQSAGALVVTPLHGDRAQHDVAWLLDLIRRRGAVRFVSLAWGHGPGSLIAWNGAEYEFNGEAMGEEQLRGALLRRSVRGRCLITARPVAEDRLAPLLNADQALLRLFVGRGEGEDAQVLGAEVLLARSGTQQTSDGEDDLLGVLPDTDTGAVPVAGADAAPIIGTGAVHAVRRGVAERRERWVDRLTVDLDAGRVAAADRLEIPAFGSIVAEIERILSSPRARFTFITIDVAIGPDHAFAIMDVDDEPRYPRTWVLGQKASDFLRQVHAARAESRRARAARSSAFARYRRRAARLRRRVRAFILRASGFIGRAARSWVFLTDQDRRRGSGFSAAEIAKAHRWGFTAGAVADFGISEANLDEFLSIRDYLYAQPVNGKYAKWIRDRVSALMVFKPFEHLFDTVHYQLVRRGNDVRIVPISDAARAAGVSLDALATMLAEHGEMLLMPTSWRVLDVTTVAHSGGSFRLDGIECAPGELLEVLRSAVREQSLVLLKPKVDPVRESEESRLDITLLNADGSRPLIAEAFVVQRQETAGEGTGAVRRLARVDAETGRYAGARALVDGRVREFDADPVTGEPISGTVPHWANIADTLRQMGAFAPQLRFVQFTLAVSAAGWRIRRVSANPRYNLEFPFQPATVQFIRESVEEKKATAFRPRARIARGLHNAKLIVRREFAAAFFPQGLLPYQSVRWPGDIRRDLVQRNGVPLRTKLWAYRRGFLSYRIPQYGITEANRDRFISDFEYRWLRHINERYKYWLEDKVSIKYVASDFNEFLPGYYFYTTRSHGRNHVVPMMDCPAGYGAEYEDVLRLAREKGKLALKPDEGSHGEGFYRLAWEDGVYSLNGEAVDEQAVIDLLADPRNQYLITEFIEMHPTIAEIYPQSVNTIRITVFKTDGFTPRIGNAYLRIGSAASGFVDNTAAGGMLAEIDVESGRFGNAQTLIDGRVQPCPRHPDTGVLIDGVIPNWEYTKTHILRMAESFSQLEYLGFDVAVTADGFKIPEINRFPDFPRIDRLTPETMDYLFHKLEEKKRRYGYDRRRGRTLVALPKRAGR